MRQWRWMRLAGAVLGLALLASGGSAFAVGLDPAFKKPDLGPQHAAGVVVWSHGRSINSEDSESPTPPYLRVLRDGGWDVLRFDRLRADDTLSESTRRLVEHVGRLKQQGYKRVVLAGQSFGAFLSLMAADDSPEVDAVVATSPAAFGSFDEFYDSWRLNATRLYPLLQGVKHARVMLFYFHGDDFDPGGRGDRSRAILSERGLGYAIVDQPAFLIGHWASSTGLFLRRFGGCIRDFIGDDTESGAFVCEPNWGQTPSAALRLPPELTGTPVDPTFASAPGESTEGEAARGGALQGEAGQGEAEQGEAAGNSAASASGAGETPRHVLDTWYGFYPNGREVLLAVEEASADALSAVYAIGPSVDDEHDAAWTRRKGHIVDDEFVFEENGKSSLRFRPSPDGGLAATWISPDGGCTMSAHLRRIDPQRLAHPDEASSAQR